MVKNIIMKKQSLKYTSDTIIGTPRNSYEHLKYIPIHIHNFEHSRVIMNMKLSCFTEI